MFTHPNAAPACRNVLVESDLHCVTFPGPPLAAGDSADVYPVPEFPHLVAKLHRYPTPELASRLTDLIARPPLDPETGVPHSALAWPTDRLMEAGAPACCAGYLMRRVRGGRPVAEFWSAAAPARVRAARDLADAVRALHGCGYVVGAWRPEHLLVDEGGRLTLISCDGCRPAGAGELGVADDLLALGGMIVRLLLGGRPYGLDTEEALPAAVREPARRCLIAGRDDPACRPTANEWAAALARVQTDFALAGPTEVEAAPMTHDDCFELEVDTEPEPAIPPRAVTILGQALPEEGPPPLPRARGRSVVPWWIGAGAGLAVACVVVVVVLMGLADDPPPPTPPPAQTAAPTPPATKPAPQPSPAPAPAPQPAPTPAPTPAPAPAPEPARPYRGPADVLAAVRDDLSKTPAKDRYYHRYLSLAHLHNDARVTAAELERHRAALASLLARLRPGAGPLAVAVDADRLLYRIDLRAAGWHPNKGWREVLRSYPYGLDQTEARDAQVAGTAREVRRLSGWDLAVLRADWFVAAAAQPPLRSQLAPESGDDLPEPVAAVLTRYHRPLDLEACAAELGLSGGAGLRARLQGNARLAALLDGGPVGRDAWAAPDGSSTSAFQAAARELGLGLPLSNR